MKQAGVFDVEERLARLSELGDQLEAFSRIVDFEAFRPGLEKALAYSDGSKGGQPPFDPLLMFKILVIQTLNNLSDERTEYLINLHALPWSGTVRSSSGCHARSGSEAAQHERRESRSLGRPYS